jgi:hypothetical protein
MVSRNVIFKVDRYWDKIKLKRNGSARFVGYLDACVDFGYMTFDESEKIYIDKSVENRIGNGYSD